MSHPGTDGEPMRTRRLLGLALLLYLPMIASAAFVQPPGAFVVEDVRRLALGLVGAALLGALVVRGSRLVAAHTAWGRRLHAEFAAVVGGLGSPAILALALLSAFGEEVLFRGVLQPRLGLWIASVLFALPHFPVRRTLVPWTLFAWVLGVVMGLLTEWSHTLWPAILLHFLVNYFNLHALAEPPVRNPATGV